MQDLTVNYFKKRPYISLVLIVLGFLFLSISWFFLIFIGAFYYWRRGKFYSYLYNIGVSIDYLFASILFNSKGHTISAIVYKKELWRSVAFVNWLFRDSAHCRTSFKKEFGKERRA